MWILLIAIAHGNHLGMCARMVGGIAMLAGTCGSDGGSSGCTPLSHGSQTVEGASLYFVHIRNMFA